jgi:hypothetical protein
VGGAAGVKIARETGRDLHAHIRLPLAHGRREFGHAPDLTRHPKRFRVHEALDQLPRLDGPILIQHDRGHVLHVVVERVAEAIISSSGGKNIRNKVNGSRKTERNSL